MNANFLCTKLAVCMKSCFSVIKRIMAKPAIIVKSPAKTLLRFAFYRSPSPLVSRMENT